MEGGGSSSRRSWDKPFLASDSLLSVRAFTGADLSTPSWCHLALPGKFSTRVPVDADALDAAESEPRGLSSCLREASLPGSLSLLDARKL